MPEPEYLPDLIEDLKRGVDRTIESLDKLDGVEEVLLSALSECQSSLEYILTHNDERVSQLAKQTFSRITEIKKLLGEVTTAKLQFKHTQNSLKGTKAMAEIKHEKELEDRLNSIE